MVMGALMRLALLALSGMAYGAFGKERLGKRTLGHTTSGRKSIAELRALRDGSVGDQGPSRPNRNTLSRDTVDRTSAQATTNAASSVQSNDCLKHKVNPGLPQQPTASDKRHQAAQARLLRQRELAELRVARQAEVLSVKTARENAQVDAERRNAESKRVAATIDLRNRLLSEKTSSSDAKGTIVAPQSPELSADAKSPDAEALGSCTGDASHDVSRYTSRKTEGGNEVFLGAYAQSKKNEDKNANGAAVTQTTAKRRFSVSECSSMGQCKEGSFCTIRNRCEKAELCSRSMTTPELYPINDICPPPPRGSSSQVPSSHQVSRLNRNQSSVVQVSVCADDCITGITFTYRDKTTMSWGTTDMCTDGAGTFDVPTGQYLSSIKVRSPKSSLSGVQFVTNKGATSPWFGQWEGRLSLHKASKGYEIWGLDRGAEKSTCSPLHKVHERLAGLR